MKRPLLIMLVMALCFICLEAGAQEFGKATFYGKNVHGKTANGERHNPEAMICAHKKHPFGTLLKVTNLKNNKTVVVRVTDRGPFGKGRIVDLSYGAARVLDFIRAGVTDVKVEVVGKEGSKKKEDAKSDKPFDEEKVKALSDKGFDVTAEDYPDLVCQIDGILTYFEQNYTIEQIQVKDNEIAQGKDAFGDDSELFRTMNLFDSLLTGNDDAMNKETLEAYAKYKEHRMKLRKF